MTVPCEHPEEIAWIKNEQRKKAAMMVAVIAALVGLAIPVVSTGLSYGALESDVEHLERSQTADREDIRQTRQDLLEQERRTSEYYQALTTQLATLTTKVESIGGQNGSANRSSSRSAR